jgi:hypothetical protein
MIAWTRPLGEAKEPPSPSRHGSGRALGSAPWDRFRQAT